MRKNSVCVLVLLVLAACSSQNETTSAVVAHQYPDQNSVGFKQFSKQCSTCHRPPMPHQHTALEWAGVVDLMQQHRAQSGYGAMSDDVKKQVLLYLQTHSQQGKPS